MQALRGAASRPGASTASVAARGPRSSNCSRSAAQRARPPIVRPRAATAEAAPATDGEKQQQRRSGGGGAKTQQQRRGGGGGRGGDGTQQKRQRGGQQQRERGGGGPGAARQQQRQQQQQRDDSPIVRVAEGSAPAGAAGCLCKFMASGEPLVRVVAVGPEALPKAAMVLTMANTMAKQDIGQMLSFQPTVITRRSAEPPVIPEGATAFYAARIPAGDVLTDNSLLATRDTDPEALGRAIIARVSSAGHTVIECLGSAATVKALEAVVAARRGLLVRLQDIACIIASAYVTQQPRGAAVDASSGDASSDNQQQRQGEAAGSGSDGDQSRQQRRGRRADTAGGAAAGSGGGGSAPRRVLANRIVVLECAPRDPSVLRVRSTYGKAG